MLLSLQTIEQISSAFLNVVHFWEDNKDEEFFLKGHAGGGLESTKLVHMIHRKSFLSSLAGYFMCFSLFFFFELPSETT